MARRVDLYLDTLYSAYSAFEMIASRITTVQHLHGRLPCGLAAVEAGADEVIRLRRHRHARLRPVRVPPTVAIGRSTFRLARCLSPR